MKAKAIFVTLALLLSIALAGNVRVMTIDIVAMQGDEFSLHSYQVAEGLVDEPEEGDYTLSVFSSDGSTLYETGFDVELLAYPSPYEDLQPDQAAHKGADLPPVEIEERLLSFNVPYSRDVASMSVAKGGESLFSAELTTCNSNGACEPDKAENFLSCPEDCPSASSDSYCDGIFDQKCDPDCTAQEMEYKDTDCTCGNGVCDEREDSFYCPEDCGKPKNTLLYAIAGGAVIALVVLGFIVKKLFFKAEKPKKEKPREKGHKTEKKEE